MKSQLLNIWPAACSRASFISCETEAREPLSFGPPEQRLVPFRHFEVHTTDTNVTCARGGTQFLDGPHAQIVEVRLHSCLLHRIPKREEPTAVPRELAILNWPIGPMTLKNDHDLPPWG
jgi:hypothetical protein